MLPLVHANVRGGGGGVGGGEEQGYVEVERVGGERGSVVGQAQGAMYLSKNSAVHQSQHHVMQCSL